MSRNTSGSGWDVLKVFSRLGLTSFGGPIAHLGYFREELVKKRAWVTESQFTQLLAICQFLPGPASSQLGFGLGYMRAGWTGALAAFMGFTLPSVVLLVAFAAWLPALQTPWGEALIQGLKLVALAVVAHGVLGMAQSLCPDKRRATIAVLVTAVLVVWSNSLLQLSMVLVGAVVGWFWCQEQSDLREQQLPITLSKRFGLVVLLLFALLFLGLSVFTSASLSPLSAAQAFFQAGALVFGGGHVVLPLLQEFVVSPGWLSADAFMAGYGAAQAIPGPMFAFSAYLGTAMGVASESWLYMTIATIMIFLPGFLLLIGVLPFWKTLSAKPGAMAAIAGINAAVVGVLFAALYDPIFTTAVHDASDLAIATIGFALLRVWGLNALWVVSWCVLASVLRYGVVS